MMELDYSWYSSHILGIGMVVILIFFPPMKIYLITWSYTLPCPIKNCPTYILVPRTVNTLRPGKNGRHFPDDIFNCIFLTENVWISIKISLKVVSKGPINNIPSLVQIMAWRRPGDKPLSEPMMVSLPTHICVTRPHVHIFVYLMTSLSVSQFIIRHSNYWDFAYQQSNCVVLKLMACCLPVNISEIMCYFQSYTSV